MNVLVPYQTPISETEFHDYLWRSDLKLEWCHGLMWPVLAGEKVEAINIKSNVECGFANQLDGAFDIYSSTLQVRVERSGLLAFPDVIIAAPLARYDTTRPLHPLLDPLVLVEILTPSTARFDLTDKWAHYQLIPTLRDYLIVFSDQMRVQHYVRQDDGSWNERVFARPAEEIQLTGIAARLTLAEVYKRVVFPDEPTSRTPRLI